MAKIIITETQYKALKRYINEEIHPSEAYSIIDSLLTVIDGKRDVGFESVKKGSESYKTMMTLIKQNGLAHIELTQFHHPNNVGVIFYNPDAEPNALKLYDIAKRRGGYLPIKTPEETFTIGMLLGYNQEAVKNFVLDKFKGFSF